MPLPLMGSRANSWREQVVEPYALLPLYAMAERFSGVRGTALRLGLVTLREMIAALVWAVENPAEGVRVLDVEEIRRTAVTSRERENRGSASV